VAWADAGPIAQIVWWQADSWRAVKGSPLEGGVSTGAAQYERGEGAKLLHGGGVFFSGVLGIAVRLAGDGLGGLGACGARTRGGGRRNGLGLEFGRFRFVEIEIPTLHNVGEEWGTCKRNTKARARGQSDADAEE
jgi:hypothetical protein